MSNSISVCIITFNESDRIERCLSSIVSIADEIIVFDSGSDDGTVEILKKYTDKVWINQWPGFGRQKQNALEKASCEWVFFIDADEELNPDAISSILEFKKKDALEETAFKIKWGVVRHGKLLRFGRSARSPIRLFQRVGSYYSDDLVHEKLNINQGKIGSIKGLLLHYTCRDYGHAISKTARYAWLGSQKYFNQGKRNRSLSLVFIRAIWTFFLIYVLRGGFLDGKIGLIVAVDYMQANFNKHVGLWLLTRDKE
jgi:glycosyltransferase involved in cell wall biosynthesis